MIQTQKYARKTFLIDAVQVTEHNMAEVAEWCQGEVLTQAATKNRPEAHYIKIRVHHPLNERQTKAFVGDWVLYAGTGYKIYTPKAFAGCFDLVDEGITGMQIADVVKEVAANAS